MKNQIIVFYPGLNGYGIITKLRSSSRTEPTVTWRVIMKKITELSRSINKNLKAKSKSIWRYIKRWFSKKRNRRVFIYFISVLTIAALTSGLFSYHVYSESKERKYEYILQERANKLQTLDKELEAVQQQKAVTETELQQKASIEADLKAEIDKLKHDLQTKRKKESLIARASQVITPKVSAAPARVSGCGDNSYANYIYMHESGCNLNAVNSRGCYGIGQDCNGIVRSRCGANYQCQNEYFTSYVNGRYGGWQQAYNFWISHHWY